MHYFKSQTINFVQEFYQIGSFQAFANIPTPKQAGSSSSYDDVTNSFLFFRLAIISKLLGSLRCRRFRSDGDVTAQVDWARGCRSRAKINLLKIS